MNTKNNKIGANFCPLTAEEARRWHEEKYLTTPGYLLAIRRILQAPGKDFVIPNVVQFCKEWGISKSSFYRAVSTLTANGEFTWEATEGIILKPCNKVVSIVDEATSSVPLVGHHPTSGTPSHERDAQSHERDAQSHERDAQSHERDAQSHERECDIYIDRARDQRIEIYQRSTELADPSTVSQNFEGDKVTHVEVEVETIESFSTTDKPQINTTLDKESLSLGLNTPVNENNSHFQTLTGKNPKTGKEYLPWQGLLTEQGRLRFCNKPEFVISVAKSLASKYSIYKKMPIKELLREADKYVERAQYRDERRSEIDGYWHDFCNQSNLPDVTVDDIKRMSVRGKLARLLNEAEQRKSAG